MKTGPLLKLVLFLALLLGVARIAFGEPLTGTPI